MTSPFPEIVCTEDTLWGSPRVDGRRLAVGDVVSIVHDSLHHALDSHELTLSQIKQALSYCSMLQCQADNPLVFCHNCSLRSKQEGPLDTSDLEEVISGDSVFVKGENFMFFGSMEDLLEDYCGYDWWIIATDLLIDLRNELPDEPTLQPTP
ncbi:MAG TPA: DUF433 domain-containing protein [Hymenobacter sp.]|jgi:uncharacterized protein (DUF433 family)|uniref:DUF433 domain-containing protein n=1 Tax=Hymenobacter sp. TaxID=1898978 RepID=UPI002ED92E5D